MKEEGVLQSVGEALRVTCRHGEKNLNWLRDNVHPYFFITMQDEMPALVNLVAGLHHIRSGRRLVLADEENKLILAGLNEPGSFYGALRFLGRKGISYAELTTSYRPVPGLNRQLEVQRFDIVGAGEPGLPEETGELSKKTSSAVRRSLRRNHRGYDFREFDKSLALLARRIPRYVRLSPPERTARILWLYQQGRRFDGLFLDAEQVEDSLLQRETRLVFAVGNPPERDFLSQVMEVFHRLEVGVRRAYCLVIDSETSPWFLGTFYVRTSAQRCLEKESKLYGTLRAELYNTQILSTTSRAYTDFVASGHMTGEDASFTNACIAFCHTSLAHNQPDRYHLSEVVGAFASNPAMTQLLSRLFRARFDPDVRDEDAYLELLKRAQGSARTYNTGHRHLDGVRRVIYRTAILFITHTLKTNFFVPEKHALVFRLDPAYLIEMGDEFTSDLPPGEPYRITFFSGRHGMGYHIGFADIARGGWRTIISADEDDYNENAESLFREAWVLAHTQHLKNKDIYEGGSKMVVILDSSDVDSEPHRAQRLYKLQFGFINAFFDIFSLEGGQNCHDLVVDYCGEEEAIELGPDENMHDSMIELIARQAVKRKYLLGRGVISSKRAGINHKEYGVTSLGVITFAEVAMKELEIDIRRDEFSVKMTGGPGGDVAGNSLRLLLERCPRVRVKLVVDGSGVIFDPLGLDRRELRRLLLKSDIDEFKPARLHEGGFLLTRSRVRRKGMRDMYRRLDRRGEGEEESWVTDDELNSIYEESLFDVPADLFIPAGGRPETIDERNWERLFDENGRPTCRAVVEGANSFITPAARLALQQKGVLIIRDASANKCGVISSSYEIIANLLMKDDEFLEHKEEYVGDVLKILEKRAGEEARLIFRRRQESGGHKFCTSISDELSREMNEWYSKLFDFFITRPELLRNRRFRQVLYSHLPLFITRHPRFSRRTARLPLKYRSAMVASEIASRIIYSDGWEEEFGKKLTSYVKKMF